MGLEYTAKIVTEGLSLYLNAADKNSFNGSGSTWYDISGQGNNGTLINGTTFSSDVLGVFIFDGSNDYVNIGVNKSCNVLTGDFTVSVWANRSNTGGTWGNVIGDYYTNNTLNNNEWQIMMSSGGAFNLYMVGIGHLVSPTSNFGANQWHNVVVTRIGSTITMYVNGTSVATVSNTSTFGTTTGNLNIGVDGNNSAEPFTGKISNVLIYKNKGLLLSEVIQNYNSTKTRFGI
jgi:hypothetical protein